MPPGRTAGPGSEDGAAQGERTARPFHAAHFYDDVDELLPALSGYVGAGLFEDCVVVIATPEHRRALNGLLDDAWVDAARAADRYVELDADETLASLMRDGLPDRDVFDALIGTRIRRAFASHPHARGYGEMVGLLLQSGQLTAALALEDLWNDLQQRHPYPMLCAYPRQSLDQLRAEAYEQVCARHTQLLMAG